jgi:hypothetical protein
MINVLEVNLELRKRFGAPAKRALDSGAQDHLRAELTPPPFSMENGRG